MINEGVRRAYHHPENVLRASILADPAARAATPATTPRRAFTIEMVPGDTLEVRRRGQGRRQREQVEVAMLNPVDSIVDWVLKCVPQMGAGWCPPGMLGIGIGGTAEKRGDRPRKR